MMKNYLTEAIRSLRPNAEFSFTDNDYSTIKWDVLEGAEPTEKEITDAIEQVKIDEIAEKTKAQSEKAVLLAKLGITAEEATLLVG